MKQKNITCCYLKEVLSKINKSMDKENSSEPIWKTVIELIWTTLEKDEKLCENCDQKE